MAKPLQASKPLKVIEDFQKAQSDSSDHHGNICGRMELFWE